MHLKGYGDVVNLQEIYLLCYPKVGYVLVLTIFNLKLLRFYCVLHYILSFLPSLLALLIPASLCYSKPGTC